MREGPPSHALRHDLLDFGVREVVTLSGGGAIIDEYSCQLTIYPAEEKLTPCCRKSYEGKILAPRAYFVI